MFFHRLAAWLQLEDYSVAKQKATDDIVARYSRGNTSMQNGHYLDREKLNQLSMNGDQAMSRLEKLVPHRAH